MEEKREEGRVEKNRGIGVKKKGGGGRGGQIEWVGKGRRGKVGGGEGEGEDKGCRQAHKLVLLIKPTVKDLIMHSPW